MSKKSKKNQTPADRQNQRVINTWSEPSLKNPDTPVKKHPYPTNPSSGQKLRIVEQPMGPDGTKQPK